MSQVALAKEDYEFVHRTADYGLWCLAKESIGPASAFREANKDFVANMEAKCATRFFPPNAIRVRGIAPQPYLKYCRI